MTDLSDIVFLSYAHEDLETAQRLHDDFSRCGVNVWFDRDSLLPGQEWKKSIRGAIEKSSFFIAILSSHSVSKRGFVQQEIRDAIAILDQTPENEIFIIPVRVDNCKPTHSRLTDLHWVDLFPNYDDGLASLLTVIQPSREVSVPSGLANHLVQYLRDIREYPDRELVPGRRLGLPSYYDAALGRIPSELYIEPMVNKTLRHQPIAIRNRLGRDGDHQEAKQSSYVPAHTVAADGHDPFTHAPFHHIGWFQEVTNALPGWRGVVVGAPGQGKSWLSQMTSRNLAVKSLDQHAEHPLSVPDLDIPVCMRCDHLIEWCDQMASGDHLDLVALGQAIALGAQGGRQWDQAISQWVSNLVLNGSEKLWLFLDAFDEAVSGLPRLKEIFDALEQLQCRVVVMTRPHAFVQFLRVTRSWPHCLVYELAPLSRSQSQRFVKQWFNSAQRVDTRDRRLLEQSAFSDVVQSPFLLTLACVAVGSEGGLPDDSQITNSVIYDRLLDEMFAVATDGVGGEKISYADVAHEIEAIAWQMTEKNPANPKLPRSSIRKVLTASGVLPTDMQAHFDFLQRSRVLCPVGLSDDGTWVFPHRELTAFLAGRFLGRTLNTARKPSQPFGSAPQDEAVALRVEKKILAEIWDPEWERVLNFALAVLNEPQELATQLGATSATIQSDVALKEWSIMPYREQAALRCLAETILGRQGKTDEESHTLREMFDGLASRAVRNLTSHSDHLARSIEEIDVLGAATLRIAIRCSARLVDDLVAKALETTDNATAVAALHIIRIAGEAVPQKNARAHSKMLIGILADANKERKVRRKAAQVLSYIAESLSSPLRQRAMEIVLSMLEAIEYGEPVQIARITQFLGTGPIKNRDELHPLALLHCAGELWAYARADQRDRFLTYLDRLIDLRRGSDAVRGVGLGEYVRLCCRLDKPANLERLELPLRFLADPESEDFIRQTISVSFVDHAQAMPPIWPSHIARVLVDACQRNDDRTTFKYARSVLRRLSPQLTFAMQARIEECFRAAVEDTSGDDDTRQVAARDLVELWPRTRHHDLLERLRDVVLDRSREEQPRIDALVILGNMHRALNQDERYAICKSLMSEIEECEEEQWNLQRLLCEVLGDVAAALGDAGSEQVARTLALELEQATCGNSTNLIFGYVECIRRLLRGRNPVACEVLIPTFIDLIELVAKCLAMSPSFSVKKQPALLKKRPKLFSEGQYINRAAFEGLSEVADVVPPRLRARLGRIAGERMEAGSFCWEPTEEWSAHKLLTRLGWTMPLAVRKNWMEKVIDAYYDENYGIRTVSNERIQAAIASGWRFLEFVEPGKEATKSMWELPELKKRINPL